MWKSRALQGIRSQNGFCLEYPIPHDIFFLEALQIIQDPTKKGHRALQF